MVCSIEKVSLRHERRVSRLAEDYVIEMLHITKEFPGIKANDDITLQLRKGEVHALLGENGAGKSTLMSVLFGLYQPEQGKIQPRLPPAKRPLMSSRRNWRLLL